MTRARYTSQRVMVMMLIAVTAAAVVRFVTQWVNRPRELSLPNRQERIRLVRVGASVSPADLRLATDAMHNWPQWRGPRATGVAPHADPPIEWSETKNVRWKIELPGKGHSTPIVWGDRIFITTAVPYGDALPARYSGRPGAHDENPITQRVRFIVMAINRNDGEILWERIVRDDLPHEGGHVTSSLASASPVTDGKLLIAFFGSYGLYCLDFEGQLKWEADLGRLHTLHGHGEGSSPAFYHDTLILNWDHEGPSFVVAFDKRTGKERWRVEREASSSWTTPIVVEQDGRPQVVISGSRRVRGYDLATGEMIWQCEGLSIENVVASPVAGNGIVYSGSTYDRPGMLAIRLDGARGDITGSRQVAWTRTRGAPYVPSPLLYEDALYFLAHFQGILTRADAETGEDNPGMVRLSGLRSVFASPVAAASRVYITDRAGTTQVITHSDSPEVLALNQLDDSFSASAALVGGDLFLRGERFLYCIAEESSISNGSP